MGCPAGGVTFSGGEPLYYSEIIGAVGEQMHRRGYNTLVETCGHVPQKALEDINGRVDYIYYDFKQIDPEKHKVLTGVDNTLNTQQPGMAVRSLQRGTVGQISLYSGMQ